MTNTSSCGIAARARRSSLVCRLAATLCALLACATTMNAYAQQQGNDTALIGMDEDEFDRVQWRYSTATVARLNPLGLVNQTQIGLQVNLFDSDGVLLDNTYTKLMFAPSVSPAFVRPGILLETQPLQILRVSVLYEYARWFGLFDSLQSFQTPTAAHSDSDRNDIDEAGGSYATSGTTLTLAAMLQAAVGPIAVRSNFRAMLNNMDLRGDDTVFYDLIMDVMTPNNGWVFTTDTDVLYRPGGKWTGGIRHTWVAAAYDDDDFLPGESTANPNTPMHRVGPLVVYQINDRTGTTFNEPTLFAMTQFWVDHRWRTGQDVSAAVPYVLLGFAFNGDL